MAVPGGKKFFKGVQLFQKNLFWEPILGGLKIIEPDSFQLFPMPVFAPALLKRNLLRSTIMG